MKKIPYLIFSLAIIIVGCEQRKPISSIELYGNSFIRMNVMEDFRAPSTWENLDLFDSAFHIRIPNYMKICQTVPLQNGYQSVIYTYNDTTTNCEEFHYGRIGFDYYKRKSPTFNKATDNLLREEESFMKPLVKAALKGGIKITDSIISQDGEILNGPFYDMHSFFTIPPQKHLQYFGYDAYYRRNGHVKGGGPVSCHIFFLMNSTESVVITVSHYDKDSLIFKNMFKIIKTFKWNIIR